MDLSEIVFKIKCGNKKGTAFLISKNRALTAFHVVTEYESNEIICTDILGKKVKASLSDKVTEGYKKLDVALLELESDIQLKDEYIFTDFSEIKRGTYWTSRGFPSAKEITGDNILLGDSNIVNQQLKVLRNNKIDIELEHSKKLLRYAGYSGSPLIINSSIAGIINKELLENGESKELTALSIKHFKELLIGEGVEVKDKKTSESNPLRKTLSNQWFTRHIEKSVSDLGVRYTPEVNVKTEITKKVNALLLNEDFFDDIRAEFHDYLVKINKFISTLIGKKNQDKSTESGCNFSDLVKCVNSAKTSIQKHFEKYISNKLNSIDINYLLEKSSEIDNIVCQVIEYERDKKNSSINHYLNETKSAYQHFHYFLNQSYINLANSPYLLLKGKAGTGKSHLLADTVVNQRNRQVPSILLLGQHFSSEKSPWSQIMDDLLRLNCSEYDLLETLNEIGEEKNQRILFSIDAINEGKGKFFWAEHLNSFINDFNKYPWVSLVLTVRDTYLRKLVPQDLSEKTKINIATHTGFSGREYEAVKIFFNHYRINLPKTPILNPEFSNPLFLKLFCEGLSNRGLSEVPEGYGGISSVMNYFIDSIDIKLGGPKYYNYGESRKVCRKIVNGLIKYKQKNEISYVPDDDACDIANDIIARYTDRKGIIEDLVHEGLFSKNLHWLDNGEDEEGIYFAYERLDDHFSAELLTDEVINHENINELLKPNGQLYYLIEEDYRYQGLIEALSIQLPEKYGKELFELVDTNEREDITIINAFVNSLTWRNPSSINKTSDQYVNETVLQYTESFEGFLELMYAVSGNVKHPYNANRLHKFLTSMALADRDSMWTPFLKHRNDSDSAIGRLLEWILLSNMHKSLSDDSSLLIAISTAWLCASTNIELRNKATKALSIILIGRLDVGIHLLKTFESIDDPYVYERILAALYGASLNTVDLSDLHDLAEYIVENIFLKEEVYPNVLVRDYARNIVEFGLFKNKITLNKPEIIRPPYNSSIPDSFPSDEEIDSFKFEWDDKDFKNEYWSQNRILSSMVTEYGRGICSYGDFGRYTFQSALYLWKELDPNPLSNYACKLIFEKFGYNVEIHGLFDKYAREGAHNENNVERIGKKYQWLALYEVIARLADNFKVKDWDDNDIGYYQGPWQNELRNIDPTHPPKFSEIRNLPIHINQVHYNDWDEDNSLWLISERNLPDPKDMITKDNFLSLQSNFNWKQEEQLGVDPNNSERKNMWYQVRSYLVKDAEFESLKSWLVKQDFMGRWLPESNENYSIFCKEHYWSPAYKDKVSENDELCWQSIEKRDYDCRNNEVVAQVLPTAEEHRWEDKEGTSFLAPRAEMFDGMKLNSSEIPSCWLDDNGELACFDPNVFGEDKSELLVNKLVLEKFLENKGMKIIWTVLGEKQILGSSNRNNWIDMSGVYYLEGGSIEGGMKINLKELGWKSKQGNKKINREVDFDEIFKNITEGSE